MNTTTSLKPNLAHHLTDLRTEHWITCITFTGDGNSWEKNKHAKDFSGQEARIPPLTKNTSLAEPLWITEVLEEWQRKGEKGHEWVYRQMMTVTFQKSHTSPDVQLTTFKEDEHRQSHANFCSSKKSPPLTAKMDFYTCLCSNIQIHYQKQLHWNPLEAVQVTVSTCKKACPMRAAISKQIAHACGLLAHPFQH